MAEDIDRINREREACRGKKQYTSMHGANESAFYHRMIHGKDFRVYKCPWCRDWHLTSKIRDEGNGNRN